MAFLIRPLRSEELAFAAEFPTLEGWVSETPEVFDGFFIHEPDGCLVAEVDGRPAGICVATSYGPAGFIGELIVRREARGRGLGPALLEAAVHYLECRGAESISLDAEKKAAPFYALSGFRPICRSLRFVGRAGEIPPMRDASPPASLKPMDEADLDGVCELDRRAFGADRSFFLRRRRALFSEYAWAAVDEEGIAGFILAYEGSDIVVVGPWVAAERRPDPVDLLLPVIKRAGEKRLRIGVLETNAAAVRILRTTPGLAEYPPCIRMVLGPSDRLGNSPFCWAIGSPAKG